MRVKVVIGAGLALVAGLVLVLLLLPDQRRAGSNYVPEYGPVTELRGSATHCEHDQLIPEDTAALNLLVGTYGPTSFLPVGKKLRPRPMFLLSKSQTVSSCWQGFFGLGFWYSNRGRL